MKVLVSQSCPTLCDPLDCSPLGSSVHGILQARIVEWVAIPFLRGSSWPKDWIHISHKADRFFTVWATMKPIVKVYHNLILKIWKLGCELFFFLTVPMVCGGEGNGNPLQCSFLENPRDRGTWWAAIYGVAQSWTWLKWLSSSSRVCGVSVSGPGIKPTPPAGEALSFNHWTTREALKLLFKFPNTP